MISQEGGLRRAVIGEMAEERLGQHVTPSCSIPPLRFLQG